MANRSYLYTVDTVPTKKKKPKPIRSLSEFNWGIPLAHKILASESPKRAQSVIWDHDIAVVAAFEPGKKRLLAFLDVLAEASPKNKKAFAEAVSETKTALSAKKHVGELSLLECGEIFEMEADSLEEIVKVCDTLVDEDIPAAREKVDAAIAGKEKKWLASVAKSWEKTLGLYWDDVLYFDFGV